MKLRTQALLGAATAVTVFATVSAALFAHDQRAKTAVARSAFATRINSEGVSGLRLVTTEYLLYGEPRARAQWDLRHAALGRLLAGHPFAGTPEQPIVDEIILRHEYAGTVFSRLTALNERRDRAGTLSAENERRDRAGTLSAEDESLAGRLATQIMLATHDMVSGAGRLAERSHAQLDDDRHTTSTVIFLVVFITAAAILATAAAALRGVIAPLGRLVAGAEAIGRGELATRIGIERDDEIGDLSRAFDRMAGQLSRSRDDLVHRSSQLEETNRELEAFSYSVSHDLRAPLRGIDGWSLALLEDFGQGLDGKARGYIETVRQEAQRMGRLIDDLLKLSRVGRAELRRERLDLSALAASIAARLRADNPARALQFEIEPGVEAAGDSHLLEIALTNLLDNAVKFTAPIAVARIEFGASEETDSATGECRMVYFVHDNGVGFDMAQARKLFGAFQRLHRASDFPGTGIGLATVRRIINRHGGQISAESKVGHGTTFQFTLEEGR